MRMPDAQGATRRAEDSGPGPSRRDLVLVVVLAGAAILEGSLRRDLAWPVAITLLTLGMILALPWRRSRPLVVVGYMTVLSTGTGIAYALAGHRPDALGAMLALILVPYALFRWGSLRSRVAGGSILGAGMLTSAVLGGDGVIGIVAGIAIVGGACLAGALRRERVRARSREIDVARAQEREMLARDLHDTVAHHVTAIAIRAQAAATVPDQEARVSQSLAAIEQEATAALTEMRALVRSLRAPADYAPTAGLKELAALATAGPPVVRVRIDDAGERIPDVVAATLFRIAQEGVTNARRHATGATAIDVLVEVQGEELTVIVRDDGSAARAGAGEGHGIRGMTERVALFGGALRAGPDASGGWVLRAAIPRAGAM